MAVDYLSTLNSKGSGLNITQIVGALVDAEVVPQQQLLQDKLEKEDVSITALASLRSDLFALSAGLGAAGFGDAQSATSSDSAVGIEITDASAAEPVDLNIAVSQLAAAQVLSFEGFGSALDVLPAGGLTITIGGDSDTDQTITLDGTDDTLADLAEALNDLDGLSAFVIEISEDNFALVVKSGLGEDSALTISADTADLAGLEWSGAGGSTNVALSGTSTPITRSQVQAAADAILSIDGLQISRSTNTIDDVVAGATLTLTEVTASSARVQITESSDAALAELQTLVDQLNAARSLIATATQRGINGAASGPLAGDTVVTQMGRWLANITTEPLTGFGSSDYYLSQLGVQTNQDGTLSIDEDDFEAAYASTPEIYDAVFNSFSGAAISGFTVTTGDDLPPPGGYDFVYTDSQTATLNGVSLIARTRANDDTGTEFYSVSGDFAGVSIYVEDGYEADTTIYFGTSLIDKITTYLDAALDDAGDFTLREDNAEDNYLDLSDRLAALEDRAVSIEARYRAKFTAMEQLITSIKSSGEYMTQLMDAWNKDE